MRHVYYALQLSDGNWKGFAQSSFTEGEDGHDEGLSWMDPTKFIFGTEAEAIEAVLDLISGHPNLDMFTEAASTDIRYAVADVASAGDDMEAGEAALSAERERAMTARAAE